MNNLNKKDNEINYYENFVNIINNLNKENMEVINSKEYRVGKTVVKIFRCLVKFKIIDLIKSYKERRLKNFASKYNIYDQNIYKNYNEDKLNYTDLPRIAIYTCIIGGYDKVLEPLFVPSNCDFYIITDNEIDKNSKWKKIDCCQYKEVENMGNVEKNRYFKMHPHIVFSEYEYSIYIDGNIQVISDLTEFVKCLGPIGIAMHSHSRRDCLYNEAQICIKLKKGNKQEITNHINKYLALGMPKRYGLFEANVIVREHNNPICLKVMDDWWEQFRKFSKRDQISFPYVLWTNNIKAQDIGILGYDVNKNYYIRKKESHE